MTLLKDCREPHRSAWEPRLKSNVLELTLRLKLHPQVKTNLQSTVHQKRGISSLFAF